MLFPKQPCGFGEHGPAGEERRCQCCERIDTELVPAVVFGEEGDQRTGVEEGAAISHARSLPCAQGWC